MEGKRLRKTLTEKRKYIIFVTCIFEEICFWVVMAKKTQTIHPVGILFYVQV